MALTLTDIERPTTPERRTRQRPSKTGKMALGPLPELIGYNLRKAQVAVFQSFQNAVAPHDITPGQFGVLIMIKENEGLSQSDLGSAVGIDRSTMVAVIDRLESRGLVIRAPSPNDRRSYALRLSPEGEKLLDELIPRIEAHDQAMVKDLSKQEQAQLIDFLRRVSKAG
ncbi:MarR family winged helix-turn-helix transcriptional regulator [Azospirillum soli]|uniref:MarR family winged helix-turn-helix transcriptional regulator n=1 Tax=Azospirillum soli TaxID=1304799 RepID=UPI001AEB8BD9|nr:MarR family transcriptional regulator [Azospirillum soli]MBP2311559.1 DNA-binding MarR family transcriptional regulator [Azospirillum soli]